MYELIILSLLMRGPAHGYMVAKVINNIIGPMARASNGRIYPLLNNLVAAGQIAVEEQEENGRQVRTYRITDEGRSRFRQLMMDTSSNPREYVEIFSFKATVLWLLNPDDRLHLIDHYIHFCRAHILHLRDGLKGFQCRTGGSSPRTDALISVMTHRVRQWELELEWGESLRAQVESDPTTAGGQA